MTSLRHAGRRYQHYEGGEKTGIFVSATPAAKFSETYSPLDATALEVSSDEVLLRTMTWLGTRMLEHELKTITQSFLRDAGASLIDVDLEGEGSSLYWSVVYKPRQRGRSVQQLIDVGRRLEAFLMALDASGKVNPESIYPLAKAGHLRVLIGQPESDWLDAKSQGYDLDQEGKRLELARDVAAFANSERGGLILIGATTRRVQDRDVIRKVASVPLASIRSRRYRAVIDARVVPTIENLEIRLHPESHDHGFLVIRIPRQAEELKPFLVHGAVAGGAVEGSYVSIVRRRGEDNVPVSAVGVHSMLVAGRALLRGTKEKPTGNGAGVPDKA